MNMFDVHKQFLAYFPPEMGVLHFEIVLLFVCVLPSFQLLNKLTYKLGMNIMQLEETPVPHFLTYYNQ